MRDETNILRFAAGRMKRKEKRGKVRYRFNLVEVTLAIAVLAVGLASVFVLFPVGLKANRNAIAENNIANAAEYIMGFVRAECQTNAIDSVAKDGRFSSSLSTVFCAKSATISDAVDVDTPGSSWSKLASGSGTGTGTDRANILQYSTPGIFLIRQISGSDDTAIVEFSAIARVYLDMDGTSGFDSVLFPVARWADRGTGDVLQRGYTDLNTRYGNALQLQYYLLPAVLEISWPADLPEARREKRLFRFEIFNDQFDQNSGEEE